MLRLGFLPSDFNPMLLMLGEVEDLRALGGVLTQSSIMAAVPEKSRYCADGSPPPLNTTTSTPGGMVVSSRTKRAWMATKNAVRAASAGRLGCRG